MVYIVPLTNTLLLPTFSRMYRMHSSFLLPMVKLGVSSQISYRKFDSICLPLMVRSTSG